MNSKKARELRKLAQSVVGPRWKVVYKAMKRERRGEAT